MVNIDTLLERLKSITPEQSESFVQAVLQSEFAKFLQTETVFANSQECMAFLKALVQDSNEASPTEYPTEMPDLNSREISERNPTQASPVLQSLAVIIGGRFYLSLLQAINDKVISGDFDPEHFLYLLRHQTTFLDEKNPRMHITRTIKEIIQHQHEKETTVLKSEFQTLVRKYETFYGQAIVSALLKLDNKRLSPELLASLINEKPLVKGYLLDLPKSEATQSLLSQCLNKTTALHQFCAKKTCLNPFYRAQLLVNSYLLDLPETAQTLLNPYQDIVPFSAKKTVLNPFGRAQLITDIEKRLQEWAPKVSQIPNVPIDRGSLSVSRSLKTSEIPLMPIRSPNHQPVSNSEL